MLRIHVLGIAAVVLGLVAVAPSLQAKQGGKKHHGLHGVVVKVEKDDGKDSGKITVKAGGKNKKTGVETPVVARTIQVTNATTFAKATRKPGAVKGEKATRKPGAVKGEKGAWETTPATFGDLKDGDHVMIEVKGDKAVEVKFHASHQKKNAA